MGGTHSVRIVVVGPGRAGGALAVAAHSVGHDVVALFGRRTDVAEPACHLGVPLLKIGAPVPEADLMVVSVKDGALATVSRRLAPQAEGVRGAVHLSGLTSVKVLAPLAERGIRVGSFHPLQTLTGWEAGSRALPGAHVGITAPVDWAEELEMFARSLGCVPFRVADEHKALYHAAGGVAANYLSATLGVAMLMFERAGVDPAVARPMIEQAVDNIFEMGFLRSLTGPISRGDWGTVRRQAEAVDNHAPQVSDAFRELSRLTASLAGRLEEADRALGGFGGSSPQWSDPATGSRGADA